MNDYELIEFLLGCHFTVNQLNTEKYISIELKTGRLSKEASRELTKTGRQFKVVAGELQFDYQNNKQTA